MVKFNFMDAYTTREQRTLAELFLRDALKTTSTTKIEKAGRAAIAHFVSFFCRGCLDFVEFCGLDVL